MAYGIKDTDGELHMDAFRTVLQQIADGEITVLGTPEEFVARLPRETAERERNIQGMLRAAREAHRRIARAILPLLELR
jgi:hypothetical protein